MARYGQDFRQARNQYQDRLAQGGTGQRFMANHPKFAAKQQAQWGDRYAQNQAQLQQRIDAGGTGQKFMQNHPGFAQRYRSQAPFGNMQQIGQPAAAAPPPMAQPQPQAQDAALADMGQPAGGMASPAPSVCPTCGKPM